MQTSHKSNVLLTELIIVVLFFSLIAVTITQLFVGAHRKNQVNTDTQRAWIIATDWAELLTGESQPAQVLQSKGFTQQPSGDYERLTEGSEFLVRVSLDPQPTSPTPTTDKGRLIEARIDVHAANPIPASDRDGLLATLPVVSYVSGEEVLP